MPFTGDELTAVQRNAEGQGPSAQSVQTMQPNDERRRGESRRLAYVTFGRESNVCPVAHFSIHPCAARFRNLPSAAAAIQLNQHV
eukprot:scaffold172254_cov31-Tisochrysis_lutea.AAC.3